MTWCPLALLASVKGPILLPRSKKNRGREIEWKFCKLRFVDSCFCTLIDWFMFLYSDWFNGGFMFLLCDLLIHVSVLWLVQWWIHVSALWFVDSRFCTLIGLFMFLDSDSLIRVSALWLVVTCFWTLFGQKVWLYMK